MLSQTTLVKMNDRTLEGFAKKAFVLHSRLEDLSLSEIDHIKNVARDIQRALINGIDSEAAEQMWIPPIVLFQLSKAANPVFKAPSTCLEELGLWNNPICLNSFREFRSEVYDYPRLSA